MGRINLLTGFSFWLIEKLQNLPDYLTKSIQYCLQAVMVDKTLYISGQLGMGKDGHMVSGGTLSQAEQVILTLLGRGG